MRITVLFITSIACFCVISLLLLYMVHANLLQPNLLQRWHVDTVENEATRRAEIASVKQKQVGHEHTPASTVNNKKAGLDRSIYWSDTIVKAVPKGNTLDKSTAFASSSRTSAVRTMLAATPERCGQQKNQYITLADNTTLCARYTHPAQYYVLGEVMAYYLARLLGLDNLAVVTLSKVTKKNRQWRTHNFKSIQWREGSFVAMVQWVENIDTTKPSVKLPRVISEANQRGTQVHGKDVKEMDVETLVIVKQFSDMIVFDYIIGNWDRILFLRNLHNENKTHTDNTTESSKKTLLWNLLHSHDPDTGMTKLWLIDHEYALLDGYRAIYNNNATGRYNKHLTSMLHSVCVFSKELIDNILLLLQDDEPHETLLEVVRREEPLFEEVPTPQQMRYFRQHFRDRLQHVIDHVQECERTAQSTRR